jgi:hypothetical protein
MLLISYRITHFLKIYVLTNKSIRTSSTCTEQIARPFIALSQLVEQLQQRHKKHARNAYLSIPNL